jgi:hypothetical protein
MQTESRTQIFMTREPNFRRGFFAEFKSLISSAFQTSVAARSRGEKIWRSMALDGKKTGAIASEIGPGSAVMEDCRFGVYKESVQFSPAVPGTFEVYLVVRVRGEIERPIERRN